MKNDLKLTLFLLLLIAYSFLSSCSFEYDNTYLSPCDNKIIGEPCNNEDNEARYTCGDLELCVICALNANEELVWFKIICEEEE